MGNAKIEWHIMAEASRMEPKDLKSGGYGLLLINVPCRQPNVMVFKVYILQLFEISTTLLVKISRPKVTKKKSVD